MRHFVLQSLTFIALLVINQCFSQISTSLPSDFSDYWYSGKAEVSSYDLMYHRYGENRTGQAVLIFVTEDFHISDQVKHEQKPSDESTTVLKLNSVKRFSTGIYDYSLMQSVFTPIDFKTHPHSLKITQSSQDWCGQSFLQMNQKNEAFNFQLRSYFQSVGDSGIIVDRVWLEDEIWTRIRISPESLPLGKVKMLPSAENTLLNRQSVNAENAVSTLTLEITEDSNREEYLIYRINYPETGRKVVIRFKNEFPYTIKNWEISEFSIKGSIQVMQRGELKQTLHVPYWKMNANADTVTRIKLGIDY